MWLLRGSLGSRLEKQLALENEKIVDYVLPVMTDALASEEIMNGKQTQDSLEELGHGENIDKSLARHDFKIGREYVSVGFQVIEIS